MKVCSVKECLEKHKAFGLCRRHYRQIKSHGRLLAPIEERKGSSNSLRFWDKVNKDGPLTIPAIGICWLWTGVIYKKTNRPFFWVGKKKTSAYRVAYELTNGPIPTGFEIRRICELGACVNPSHMRLNKPHGEFDLVCVVDGKKFKYKNDKQKFCSISCMGIAKRKSIDERFWLKVEKTTSCWLWTGYITPFGYGAIQDRNRSVPVHRFSYELAIGPIPEGLEVDHTCHNEDNSCNEGNACTHRRCVNPSHLEAATPRDNTLRGRGPSANNARKTHCKWGHELSGSNLRAGSRHRICKACANFRAAQYRSKTAQKVQLS